MRIKRLPNHVANQIAAGEVIERPASVVKELLENSLDAGARSIMLTVHKGGKELMRISDDGNGIHPQDFELAVASHATSKLYEFSELEHIASLGFRGEALASIRSVSQFRLVSCTKDQTEAYELLNNECDQSVQIKPAAHPVGTTIDVSQLFYNTPARRKFLRADKTEYQHIEEVVKRVALSRFDVALSLSTEKKLNLALPAALTGEQQSNRVAKILGSSFRKHARSLDCDIGSMRLWGWVTDAEFFRSASDCQYFYINGRIIKDRLINHAVRQAYQDVLYQGRQPGFVLYLEIDPKELDVNVHPTKQEVRFRESRLIHDFIFQSVHQALFERVDTPTVSAKRHSAVDPGHRCSTEAAMDPISRAAAPVEHKLEVVPARVIGSAHTNYLIVEENDLLRIINMLAIEQYKLRISLQQAQKTNNIKSKALLIPEVWSGDPSRLQQVDHFSDALMALGIDIGLLSDSTVALRQLPRQLQQLNTQTFLSKLVDYLADVCVPWGEQHIDDIIELMLDSVELSATAYADQQKIMQQFYQYSLEMQRQFSRTITREEMVSHG